MNHDPDLPVVLDLFERRLQRDQQAGELLPASAYQELFPGFEEPIARHYHRFLEAESAIERASQNDSLHAFMRCYEADREQSVRRGLEDYLAMFPGQEVDVASRFAELQHDEEARAIPTLATGDELGHYRLDAKIGAGGQGVVWSATDTRLQRRVAIKVLGQARSGVAEALARFTREAAIAARLQHPGICTVHDTGVHKGCPFLVLQLISGRNLGAWIKDTSDSNSAPIALSTSPLDAKRRHTEVLRMAERVARALHRAHESGIVHRDVKPQNIMINESGRPVLLDFGLATGHDRSESLLALTQSGDRLGTPAYMSPEQIGASKASIDRRTDIYSLGVVLYECITRHRPFRSSHRPELYDAIRKDPVPSVRKTDASLPKDLDVVIATATAKSPDARYQSAADLAEDLARLRRGEPVRARRPSLPVRLLAWTQANRAVAAMLVSLGMAMLLITVMLRIASSQAREAAAAIETEERARHALTLRHEQVTKARSIAFRAPLHVAFAKPSQNGARIRGVSIYAASIPGKSRTFRVLVDTPRTGRFGLPEARGSGQAGEKANWCDCYFDTPITADTDTLFVAIRGQVDTLFPLRTERLEGVAYGARASGKVSRGLFPVSMRWILE